LKIYHHNDLDGRCAGAIALRVWRQLGQEPLMIELDYKDKVDINFIEYGETIIILDFSFKPDVMEKVRERTGGIIWIDHHRSAESYPYQDLKGLRDFADKNESGCELTWKFFCPHKPIPRAVELIGDYDKWALKFQPECFEFYEGMKMEVTNPQSDLWDNLFNFMPVTRIIDQGKSAIRYRDNYCEKICHDFGYEVEWEGHKAFVTNFFQFGSGGFGERMERYDFCIAYIHDGKRFTVSLYSIKEVDVSEICKRHGGGGHKEAAGFVCDELPFKKI